MRHEELHADAIVRLLRKQKVATMAELKGAVGTEAERTVFRKLKGLAYRTSYSHKGRYYTLDEIARFDDLGLWSWGSVWFSKHGTLLATAQELVETGDAGFLVSELDHVLHVGAKDALRILFRQGRIAREDLGGRYLYCSRNPGRRRLQLVFRRAEHAPAIYSQVVPEELKAAIVLFFSLLDERQRRLYAGLESLKVGHGGIQQMADLLGVDEGTVARGRAQLLQRDVDVERVRRAGGGRKALEKKPRKSSRGSKS